jgi:hypothetical protein
MTDAALERHIEQALAVDPSPEFVARVRTRIAEEPSPAARRFGWLFASVATAAVAASVVALVMVRPDQRVEPAKGLLMSRALTSSVVVPVLSQRLDRERRTTNLERRTSNREPRTTNDERPSSFPLFDTRETMALQRLIAGVREGKVDLNPVQNASTPTVMDLPPVVEIVIPPITITPLGESGQGERQ